MKFEIRKRTYSFWLGLVLIFLGVFESGLHAQATQTKRILFIGNSYTYYWNLPQNVAQMAEERKIPMQVQQSTSGGVNLEMHWKSARNLKTMDLIREGNFDAIVLQDQSLRPVLEPDSTLKYGTLLGEAIKSSGAQPFVYLTWARKNNPMMQSKLNATYKALANKIGGKVVPVGPAWKLARSLRPDIALFEKDGSHPSSLGTYLTACVFFKVLTGETPVRLPSRLLSEDKHGQKLYLNIIDPVDALFCQQIAEQSVNDFK